MTTENNSQPEADENGYYRPSKSQIKREMHALVDLGKELIDLPNNKLDQLPLAEKLREAIELAKRINSREGKRRQIHFVGKLLRQADIDTIKQKLVVWKQGSQAATRTMHRIETLRDELMSNDELLTELLDKYPQVDSQLIRSQIRAARKEAQKNTTLTEGQEPAKKHYRALFQTLKQIDFED